MIKYRVTIYCRDCTGQGNKGCYDGQPWVHGEYDTMDEAIEEGHIETDDVGSWYYKITEIN